MTGKDFLFLTPYIITATAPVVIMLVISLLRNYKVVFGFSVLSLLCALCSVIYITPLAPHSIGPLFIIDAFSLFFTGIILISALLVTLLSYDYIQKVEGVREEYYIVIFTATLGAILLTAANHFVLFFLGIETLSISLYILIAFRKSESNSIEAGIKYLILASVSSAFLLFGMALIYTAFGTMQFDKILSFTGSGESLPVLVITGFGMMIVGIGFKLALVPFHMWTPDVYQGAPAPVSAYVATVSKGAVMAVLIRFFFTLKGFGNYYLIVSVSAIAILSMFIGNFLALKQMNLKRLLGYSSIANMGYLIIILLTGTNKGIQASVFYLISYFFTTLGSFAVISLLSTSDKDAENIEDYKGLFWKRPGIAIVFTLSLLSLAGIPLTAGFIAKFYVIIEGMNAGLMILIFSLIINSVIGLYYYLRIITTLFAPASEKNLPLLSLPGHVTLALIGIIILLLGVYPGWLIDLIEKFVSL
jgi:NADH-quinone oxidoreductase subunit N